MDEVIVQAGLEPSLLKIVNAVCQINAEYHKFPVEAYSKTAANGNLLIETVDSEFAVAEIGPRTVPDVAEVGKKLPGPSSWTGSS